ncbi:hypothetical protein [Prauserella muralis]|nr:hypothetical protein [Prauserella muralis]TWE13655.1 hypothetical protein FHX69_5780 [Prauserella muralis]
MNTSTIPQEQQPGPDAPPTAGEPGADEPAPSGSLADDDEFAPTIVRGRE